MQVARVALDWRSDIEVRLRPVDRERLEAVLADRNSPRSTGISWRTLRRQGGDLPGRRVKNLESSGSAGLWKRGRRAVLRQDPQARPT
jgi:hypothetical protein